MGKASFSAQARDLLDILKNISADYTPKKAEKVLRLAVQSLMRHKLRSGLSILGVVCGVIAVLAMLSIGEGAKQEAMRQIEQLGIRNIYVKSLPLTAEQKLKAREGRSRGVSTYDAERIINGVRTVDDVAVLREVRASVVGMNRELLNQIIATSENYARVQSLQILQGRFISREDTLRNSFVCVIGDGVASRLGHQGKVGGQVRVDNTLFSVIGILKRVDIRTAKSSVISTRNYNDMIIIPLGADRWLADGSSEAASSQAREGVHEIIARVRESGEIIDTAQSIKRVLEVSHNAVMDYQLVIPQELLEQARKTQRTFNIVLGTIAFISLLVGGIGIMNIMLATVTERTREIGIRRAVGASREHIIVQFLSESVVLTSAGGLMGILCGIVTVFVITFFSGWRTSITFLSLFLSLFMSVFVGISFGLYPAYKASRMDPIEALRNE